MHCLFLTESSGSCRLQSRHGTRKGRVLKSKVLDLLIVNSVQREAFNASSNCTVLIVLNNCTAIRSARVQWCSVCSLWYEESHYRNTIWGPRTVDLVFSQQSVPQAAWVSKDFCELWFPVKWHFPSLYILLLCMLQTLLKAFDTSCLYMWFLFTNWNTCEPMTSLYPK